MQITRESIAVFVLCVMSLCGPLDAPAEGKTTVMADHFASLQAAITNVCSRGGGVVLLPKNYTATLSGNGTGEWSLLKVCDNLALEGVGSSSVIKIADKTQGPGPDQYDIIFANNTASNPLKNFSARNLTVDFNGPNNVVPADHPGKRDAFVFAHYGEDWTIEGVTFLNNPGRQTISCGANVAPQSCQRIKILNNTFHNAGSGVPGNTHQSDHSSVYLQAVDSEVYGNEAFNDSLPLNATAYEIHTRRSRVQNNHAKNWTTAYNLVATVTDFTDNVISKNVNENVQYGFRLWDKDNHQFSNIEFRKNSTVLAATSGFGCLYGVRELDHPVMHLEISGDTCTQTAPLARTRLAAAGIVLSKCSDILISYGHYWNLSGRGIDLFCGDNSTISNNEISNVCEGGNSGGYTQAIAIQTNEKIIHPVVHDNHVYNLHGGTSTLVGLELGGNIESPEVYSNRFDVQIKVSTRRWAGKPGTRFSLW